jgi:hypothetical protein
MFSITFLSRGLSTDEASKCILEGAIEASKNFNSLCRIECDKNLGIGILILQNGLPVIVTSTHVIPDKEKAFKAWAHFTHLDNTVTSFKLRPDIFFQFPLNGKSRNLSLVALEFKNTETKKFESIANKLDMISSLPASLGSDSLYALFFASLVTTSELDKENFNLIIKKYQDKSISVLPIFPQDIQVTKEQEDDTFHCEMPFFIDLPCGSPIFNQAGKVTAIYLKTCSEAHHSNHCKIMAHIQPVVKVLEGYFDEKQNIRFSRTSQKKSFGSTNIVKITVTKNMDHCEEPLSFEEYQKQRLESFEHYKTSILSLFPTHTDEQIREGYEGFCHSRYSAYKHKFISDNNPGTIL